MFEVILKFRTVFEMLNLILSWKNARSSIFERAIVHICWVLYDDQLFILLIIIDDYMY